MMLHSCTDEGIVDAPSWHQAVEQGDNAIMRAAKAMVEGTQGEMSIPDMVKTLGKSQTRAEGAAPQTLAAGSFTIDWDAAQSLHEEDGTVLLVPIKMKQNMAIWRFTVINNKRKAEQTPMHSVLYVKKFDSTGNIMGRVLSYAPSRQYIKRHPKYKKKIEWYNPDHTDYSGLLLISSLDGTLFHGFNYENGRRQYTFRPNIKTHEHHHETSPITRALTTTDNRVAPIQAPVFNMRLISSASAISTYSFDNETYEQPGCIFCGGNPYTCDCFIVEACSKCHKLIEDCICPCPFCDLYPCGCGNGNCLFCNKPLHECECGDTIGGGGGGTCSGTGTGTSPGTGGTSTGGGGGTTNTSPPTITGGTAEQRATIQSIVNELVSVYNLNMNGINIQVINQCIALAQISEGYTGIDVCNEFFTFTKEDQTSILWHEMYHYNNDDKSWMDLGDYNIKSYTAIPPADIDISIKYLIEEVDGFPRQIYDKVIGKYIDNPAWNQMYYYRTLINDFKNPIYTENEINAYEAEINEFTNVSERYRHERILTLWMHKERMKKFKQLGL